MTQKITLDLVSPEGTVVEPVTKYFNDEYTANSYLVEIREKAKQHGFTVANAAIQEIVGFVIIVNNDGVLEAQNGAYDTIEECRETAKIVKVANPMPPM